MDTMGSSSNVIRLADLVSDTDSILFVGAHPDDIEIGCGATMLRIRSESPLTTVHTLVMSVRQEREREAHAGAETFVGDTDQLTTHDFRDGFLPWSGGAVKESFASAVEAIQPGLVFVHNRGDAHQDHRLLGELAIQVARSATILEYEIPKYDGDFGRPNLYVPAKEADVDAKIQGLRSAFPSQATKDWFDDETFRGLMRLRGVECRSRYAEAFWARKLVMA